MEDGRHGILGELVQQHVEIDNKGEDVSATILHQQTVELIVMEKNMNSSHVHNLHVPVT